MAQKRRSLGGALHPKIELTDEQFMDMSTPTTYKEAKDLQTLRIKETEKTQVKACNVPMSTVLDLFLSSRKHCVKESTYAKYRRDIDNHIRPYWGNILLTKYR